MDRWVILTRKRSVRAGYTYISLVAATAAWVNMPAALTELNGSNFARPLVDLSKVGYVNFMGGVNVPGAAGSEVRLQYSTDNGATWGYLGAGTAPSFAIDTAGIKSSGWVAVVPAARREVLVRIVGINGNGAADPSFWNLVLKLRHHLPVSHHRPAGVYHVVLSGAFPQWSNMPAAETEFLGAMNTRTQIDLSAVTHALFSFGVSTIGAAGSLVRLQYSADNGATWNSLGASNTPAVPCDTLGYATSGWVAVVPAARREVLIRAVGVNGNGAADPVFGPLTVILRNLGPQPVEERVVLFYDNTWSNQPVALTEFLGVQTARFYADLSRYSQVDMRCYNVLVAGAAGSEIRAQYSTDGGTTWKYFTDTAPSFSISSTGGKSSGWVGVPSDARRVVLLRVVGINGNGVADPRLQEFYFRFR